MRANPYMLQTLKFATLTLTGVLVVIAVAFVMKDTGGGTLTGRLVQPQIQGGSIPTVKYDEARAIEGFSAPASTSVIFTVPQGVRIPRITFFGGPDYDEKRYWGYCFSGNENDNKAKGYLGKKMYDGQFFYSIGERKSQVNVRKASDNDLVGILADTTRTPKEADASIAEILYGGQTCYVMSEVVLPVGVDTDGDDFNNARERDAGTDPNYPDTDNDGIPDGTEVFKTKTDPKQSDTDRDGLTDRCEDKNADGRMDNDETSALVTDTDRDGLCDGDGYGYGCPEPKQTVCFQAQNGERECTQRPSTPVFGEDMNQNCTVDNGETNPRDPDTFGQPDWDYKWGTMQQQLGDRPSDSAIGTQSYEFPIPNLPVGDQQAGGE
jgi:hypothetical protein